MLSEIAQSQMRTLRNCNCNAMLSLGKPVSTKTDEFPENFRKGGEGVISDPKNFIAIFFALEFANCKFSAGATGLRKKSQYFFPKKGGVRGRSEIFRKFIRFGRYRLRLP